MEKEVKKPVVRNKEKSKQRLLAAVGKILKAKGFAALKVNDIAAVAGLDKKLIYNYFGGTDGLIDEYIRSLDFWSNVSEDDAPGDFSDGGQDFTRNMIQNQYDYVAQNKELQKILLWGITEQRKSLKKIADEREANGEVLMANITDPFFGEQSEEFRAAMAILISGAYYLNMYTTNAKTFCGIDLTQPKGREQIKNALGMMVDLVYERKRKG